MSLPALPVSGRSLSRGSPWKISRSAVSSPLVKARLKRVQFCNYTYRFFVRGRVLMEFSSPKGGWGVAQSSRNSPACLPVLSWPKFFGLMGNRESRQLAVGGRSGLQHCFDVPLWKQRRTPGGSSAQGTVQSDPVKATPWTPCRCQLQRLWHLKFPVFGNCIFLLTLLRLEKSEKHHTFI